jgi:large subunit ribosomal protein L21
VFSQAGKVVYAIIESGGKQHRVAVGDVVRVERRQVEVGDGVVFDRVLVVGGDGRDPRLGRPTVDGAVVRGRVVAQDREPRIRTYTFKRRSNAARKNRGHRQDYTAVAIEAIEG